MLAGERRENRVRERVAEKGAAVDESGVVGSALYVVFGSVAVNGITCGEAVFGVGFVIVMRVVIVEMTDVITNVRPHGLTRDEIKMMPRPIGMRIMRGNMPCGVMRVAMETMAISMGMMVQFKGISKVVVGVVVAGGASGVEGVHFFVVESAAIGVVVGGVEVIRMGCEVGEKVVVAVGTEVNSNIPPRGYLCGVEKVMPLAVGMRILRSS